MGSARWCRCQLVIVCILLLSQRIRNDRGRGWGWLARAREGWVTVTVSCGQALSWRRWQGRSGSRDWVTDPTRSTVLQTRRHSERCITISRFFVFDFGYKLDQTRIQGTIWRDVIQFVYDLFDKGASSASRNNQLNGLPVKLFSKTIIQIFKIVEQ